MSKLSIRDLDLAGKRVFVRVDFNVPLDGERVTDDTRISRNAAHAEIGARTRGPAGAGFAPGPAQRQTRSEIQLAARRGETGGTHRTRRSILPPIAWARRRKPRAARSTNGGILLLENVRYHAEEEANDAAFSRQLAALCDGLFVCDAFGSAHRAHASVVGITQVRAPSRGGPADGARTGLSRQGADESRSGRLSRCSAARKFPTRSKWWRT